MVNYGTIVINYGTICMVEPTKLVINSTFRHLLGVAIILEFRANHRQLGKSWGDLGLNILGNIGHIYICIHIIYIYISLSHMLSLAHLLPLLHPCAIYIDLLVQEPKRSKVPSHMPAFKANLFPLLRPCAIRFPESKAQESMLSVAHLLPLLSPCAV